GGDGEEGGGGGRGGGRGWGMAARGGGAGGSALGHLGFGFLGCSGQGVLGVASGMDDLPRNAHALSSGQKYRTLLAVAEAILSHRDLHALFHGLTDRLQQVVRFDYLILVLHDAANNMMRRHILETSDPSPIQAPTALSVEEGPAGWVWQTQQPLIIS